MISKEKVIEIINSMPDEFTLEELIERLDEGFISEEHSRMLDERYPDGFEETEQDETIKEVTERIRKKYNLPPDND